MARFILDRCVRLVLVLVAITVVSFLFLHLIPERSSIAIRLGQHVPAPSRSPFSLHEYGLDQPWWVQLGKYFVALLHGNLGVSGSRTRSRSHRRTATYFPATVELTLGAMIVAVVVGIPAGVYAAVRRRSFVDALTMSGVLLGVSVPVFWLGWMLVYALAVLPARAGLDLFPISGRISLLYDIPPRTHLIVVDALLGRETGARRSTPSGIWSCRP